MRAYVARAFASQLRALKGLLSRLLVEVIEGLDKNFESIDPSTGAATAREGIVLRDSKEFVERLEKLNQNLAAGVHDVEDIVELMSYDVEALYPSLHKEYII